MGLVAATVGTQSLFLLITVSKGWNCWLGNSLTSKTLFNQFTEKYLETTPLGTKPLGTTPLVEMAETWFFLKRDSVVVVLTLKRHPLVVFAVERALGPRG